MINIDHKDKRPIYEQIVDKISDLVTFGGLKPDEKLPSVRMMSIDLSINPNTIQKAYQELERKGIIYTVKGKGNFINSDIEETKKRRVNELYRQIDVIIIELMRIGQTTADISSFFEGRDCI